MVEEENVTLTITTFRDLTVCVGVCKEERDLTQNIYCSKVLSEHEAKLTYFECDIWLNADWRL